MSVQTNNFEPDMNNPYILHKKLCCEKINYNDEKNYKIK